MKKKSIVENDKAKIEQVIAELDEKKNEALKKAFEKVNKVSSVYNTLHFCYSSSGWSTSTFCRFVLSET